MLQGNNPIKLIACTFSVLLFVIGCAPSWNGKIIYLDNGKLLIQTQNNKKIRSGQKLMISRQKTITHPITNDELGTIKDDIAIVTVMWVNDKTVIAQAKDPWFDMMMVDDIALPVRGAENQLKGSVIQIGKIESIDEINNTVELSIMPDKAIFPEDDLVVIKYTDTIADPETDDILAVKVKPVSKIIKNSGSDVYTYNLTDKTVDWIEFDDIVVKRIGDMQKETFWFQDVPKGFSEDMIYNRNYLRAIRNINNRFYKEAMLELDFINKINPDYKDIGYLIGFCYARLNRNDDALKYFKEYIESKQNDPRIWTEIAYIYLKQEKYQEAIDAYEKLANLIPNNPKIWVDIGDVYRQLGNIQKAEQSYKKAIEIQPDNQEAKYELQIINP